MKIKFVFSRTSDHFCRGIDHCTRAAFYFFIISKWSIVWNFSRNEWWLFPVELISPKEEKYHFFPLHRYVFDCSQSIAVISFIRKWKQNLLKTRNHFFFSLALTFLGRRFIYFFTHVASKWSSVCNMCRCCFPAGKCNQNLSNNEQLFSLWSLSVFVNEKRHRCRFVMSRYSIVRDQHVRQGS